MPINVYLVFNGTCREAMEFYAKVFKTNPPRMMTFGEAPPQPDYPLPEEAKNLIMHSMLNINGSILMASDTFPGAPVVTGNNITLAYVSNNVDEIKSYFTAIKEGGEVSVELQETFFSKCYGKVKDKFGIEWQFSHDSEGLN